MTGYLIALSAFVVLAALGMTIRNVASLWQLGGITGLELAAMYTLPPAVVGAVVCGVVLFWRRA